MVTLPLFVTSCATPRSAPVPEPPPTAMRAVVATKLVETPYELRGYREAANASVRHEPHRIFRSTRVPVAAADELATVPRTTYPPASLSPLPINEELSAEIATQRKMTEEIRALQASLIEAEARMREQYALLVRQSSEALKVRRQLEAERERVRLASAASSPAPTEAKTVKSTDAKW